MNAIDHERGGMQPWAVLLLCRAVLFLCGDMPFTTAYATGTLLSIAAVGILSVPLWLGGHHYMARLSLIYRITGIYTAALILSRIYVLLQSLQSAYPLPTLLLILLAACYGLTLPRRATGRAAKILTVLFGAGVILLLYRGFSGGEPLLLYTPAPRGIADCFLYAMGENLPLAFLPLCIAPQQPAALRRKWLCGSLGSLLIFVLLIGAGALQNGRLSRWEGNPFFLLVAQSQSDAAIRTDGFWIGLLLSAGIMSLVFCMQICTAHTPEHTPTAGEALFFGGIIAAGSILFMVGNHPIWLTVLLLCITVGVLPLIALLRRKRGASYGS